MVSAPPGSGLSSGERVLLYPAACSLPIPVGLRFEEAAALPIAYLTAWRMLFGWNRPLGPGQTVLVVGAGGGVASACVQLAHLAGARVLATSSGPEKLAHATALGATVTIDYRTEDVPKSVLEATGGVGADLVVDSVGAATWGQPLRAVRRGGRVVTCGATTGGDPPAELQRVFIRQIHIQGSTFGSVEEFRRLLAVVATGRLRPTIERGFSLEEVPAALDYLASGGQLLLRRSRKQGDPTLGPSAAMSRWRVVTLPSPVPLPHSPETPGLARACWRIDLLRCRGASSASWNVEGCDQAGRMAPARAPSVPDLAPSLLARISSL